MAGTRDYVGGGGGGGGGGGTCPKLGICYMICNLQVHLLTICQY